MEGVLEPGIIKIWYRLDLLFGLQTPIYRKTLNLKILVQICSFNPSTLFVLKFPNVTLSV